MRYIDRFVTATYSLASALVDASTLDSIDMERCMSESVNDICRLKYWSMPINDKQAPGYFNATSFHMDQLSQNNALPSIMDCAISERANCIDRTNPMFNN